MRRIAAYHEDLSGALPEAPRRQQAASSVIASSDSFLAEQKALAVSRAQRFAAELAKPPPPLQSKRIAWSGGKIASNKDEAVAAFIARRQETGQLSSEEEAVLNASLKRRTTSLSEAKTTFDVQTADSVPPATYAPVLAGRVFALSVGGDGANQRELTETIKRHGGSVSRTVHRKVQYLLASEQAVHRNTQAVRKANLKFGGILLLRASFVSACVREGGLVDPGPHLHPPRAAYVPARERAKVEALSTPAEVAPAEPPAQRKAKRSRGSGQPPAAAVGNRVRKRPRLPWPHSMAPCSSLACLEMARYRRAQRKHAAHACTAARRALKAVWQHPS
jgi:hypothetical protein